MNPQIITKTLKVEGMTCSACELRIEDRLNKLDGIVEASVSYPKGTVRVKYDPEHIKLPDIIKHIERLDYAVLSAGSANKSKQNDDKKLSITSLIGIGVIIFAVYWIVDNTIGFNFLPEVDQSMGFAMLFIVGLLTSVHCISMCGGINLSQSVGYRQNNLHEPNKFDKFMPSLLYNAGRVTSYTIIGGIVGAIGSIISLSGAASGMVSIIAGAFMILMGLNMMNVFPSLRKLTPRMPRFIAVKVNKGKTNKSPFVVGLLTGFMPCGPLQTMQIYAMGTGSAVMGALSMFFFSVGTVPLMFAFGAISTLLSSKFTARMMKVSAILVMILGVTMLNRGFSLSGVDPFSHVTAAFGTVLGTEQSSSNGNVAEIRDGVQFVSATFTGRRYEPITVQAGIPVVWTIDVEAINGCNNPIVINEFGLRIDLSVGENIVEFTPTQVGIIPYSCWMGMIRSRIIVVDDLGDLSSLDLVAFEDDYEDEECPHCAAVGGGFFDSDWEPVIPIIETVQVAEFVGDIQEITISMQGRQFSTDVIVLQEDRDFIIRFDLLDEPDLERIEAEDWLYAFEYFVEFPGYGGGLFLVEEPETPILPIIGDFIISDGFFENFIVGIIVTDINNFDEATVLAAAQEFLVEGLAGDGFACH